MACDCVASRRVVSFDLRLNETSRVFLATLINFRHTLERDPSTAMQAQASLIDQNQVVQIHIIEEYRFNIKCLRMS